MATTEEMDNVLQWMLDTPPKPLKTLEKKLVAKMARYNEKSKTLNANQGIKR